MEPFEATVRRGGVAAVREASRFFMRTDPVHESLGEIALRLGKLGILYAVMGGMALVW